MNLRVLFLSHNFIRKPGDFSGKFLFDLARGLLKKGVKVSVLVPHEGSLPLQESIGDIDIHRFRYASVRYEYLAYKGNMHELIKKNFLSMALFVSFMFSFLINAVSLIQKQRPHIIHSHWWIPSGVIGSIVSRYFKIPLIVTSHGTDIRLLDNFKYLIPLWKFVISSAKMVTTTSDFLKRRALEILGISSQKFQKIPMPVAPEDLKISSQKRKYNQIIVSARLSKQKGVNYLIEACRYLKNKKISFNLIILGDGEERGNLQKQVLELGLKDYVRFEGMVPHTRIGDYLSESGICILPSIKEGFGVALIEAMFCKTPVIGSNSGSIPEIIMNNKTGLLVPPKNPMALAKAIEFLLKNKKFTQRLTEEGYDYALANFTPEVVAEKMKQIYDKVA